MNDRRPTREELELLRLYRECTDEWREFVIQTAVLAASQRAWRAEIISFDDCRHGNGKGVSAR